MELYKLFLSVGRILNFWDKNEEYKICWTFEDAVRSDTEALYSDWEEIGKDFTNEN